LPRESNNEEESEIIFQNSDYSKEISLLINNDYLKNSSVINNKNINNNTSNIPNINIDNVGLKDTSIISNFGIKVCKSITQAGKERIGRRKKNQDFYIIEKNINNISGFNLFAILDGHGVNGHMVSQFASKLLIKKFTNITKKFNDTESIYNFLKKSDYQKIIDIFLEIDKQIMDQKNFDITLSGTTCCLVIQLYEHIICPNIGDSRAILIFDENKIFELSHDSKPEVPEETKRINLMGGIVDRFVNTDGEKTGPYRVYIQDSDQPGLAMSRSFGDKKAKFCGVIPFPDIIEYTLNNESKYMVICSDGVWEFLSNEDVMKIGNKYYRQNNINEFCTQLLKKSTEMWELEENYIDDITIVTVFF
jgi:serine/threonine protein phosphatase PrpC